MSASDSRSFPHFGKALIAAFACTLALVIAQVVAPAQAQAAPAASAGDGTYGFNDITPGDWYANDEMLGYAVGHGFLKGYETGGFGAYDNVTRGQMATILYRMAGEPEATAQPFPDVDYSSYYGDAIIWARSTGVITGYINSEGLVFGFGPDDAITREQLAVMLARYARMIQGFSVGSDRNAMHSMPDGKDVSSWAATAIAWCLDNGIMSGDWAGSQQFIHAGGNAQRAHVAKMVSVLYRDTFLEQAPPDGGKGTPQPYEQGDAAAAAQYLGQQHEQITDAYFGDSRIHGTGVSQQDKMNAYAQYSSMYLALMYEAFDFACGMTGVYDATYLAMSQEEWERSLADEASYQGSSILDNDEAMVKVAETRITWQANQAQHYIGLIQAVAVG